MDGKRIRPLNRVGSSYRDYRRFPEQVQDEMGFALYRAQIGEPARRPKLIYVCSDRIAGFDQE